MGSTIKASAGITTLFFLTTISLISTGSIVSEALAFKLTASPSRMESQEVRMTPRQNFIPLSTSFAGHTGDLVCPHKLAEAKLFRKVLPMLI
jgi:hypothetical protein